MHVKEQTLTKGRLVEIMKEEWIGMMKCVNCDPVMLLEKYLR